MSAARQDGAAALAGVDANLLVAPHALLFLPAERRRATIGMLWKENVKLPRHAACNEVAPRLRGLGGSVV